MILLLNSFIKNFSTDLDLVHSIDRLSILRLVYCLSFCSQKHVSTHTDTKRRAMILEKWNIFLRNNALGQVLRKLFRAMVEMSSCATRITQRRLVDFLLRRELLHFNLSEGFPPPLEFVMQNFCCAVTFLHLHLVTHPHHPATILVGRIPNIIPRVSS